VLTSLLPFLWAAAIDPCAPIEAAPPSPRDRGQVAVYLGIGDDELRAGARDTAIVAFQEVVRREPSNPHARAALARLCQETRGAGAGSGGRFAEALALMDAGRRREAAALFEEVRLAEDESAAALLEGVCLYELHDDRRAEPLLREAAADPALAESARVFLGLLALRADDRARATELLRAAAASDSPTLRQTAAELLRAARRDGRGGASLLAETGYDSNVALTPNGTPTLPNSRDGAVGLAAAGSWRPLGRSGPYLRGAGQYRKQLQLGAYDLGAIGGALGWRQFLSGAASGGTVAGEYSYDFFTLGGASYLSAHRLAAEGELEWARVVLALNAFARFESYPQAETAGYSGTRLAGEATVSLRFVSDLLAGCGYRLGHDGAREASLAYWEHGPACHVWWSARADVRLLADASLAFRSYEAPDPMTPTIERRDRIVDGLLAAEWNVRAQWALRLALTARKAASTLPDVYAYTRVTATLAAVWMLAFL